MDNIQKIKKRLQKSEKTRRKNPFYFILMTTLTLISLTLGFLIYAHFDESGAFLFKAFGIKADFSALNSKVNGIVDDIFNFNILGQNGEDETVSAKTRYIPLGNDYYQMEDQRVLTIHKGTIVYISEDDLGDFVVISYENGVVGSYFALEEILVKRYDVLKKGEQVGSYSGSFKVIFSKNDKKITYEEALL